MSEFVARIIRKFLFWRNHEMPQFKSEKDFDRIVMFSEMFLFVGWLIALIVLVLSPGGLFEGVFPFR